MPHASTGRIALAALVAILASSPTLAAGSPRYEAGLHRHVSARALPPEVRYRDPRYVPPPPRHAPRLGPPAHLIEAYLPRTTDVPLYNEPPSRFPTR